MPRQPVDLASHLNQTVTRGHPADFPVALRPVLAAVGDSYRPVPRRFGVIREDTAELLAIVSDRYTLVPHQRILDLVDAALQGLYPLPAPLGYLDRGKGNPKEPDPERAPLVRKAFELYATGQYNLDLLTDELSRLGLRNRRGGRVTRAGLSVMLNNPFYIGLIRLRRTGETFPGAHQPLISKSLFDQVRQTLNAKTPDRRCRHAFLFRRLLTCRHCGYSLIGERQKGRVYYRCHTRSCPAACIREDAVEAHVAKTLAPLHFTPLEKAYLQQKVAGLKARWEREGKAQTAALRLRLGQLQKRLARLTDAYVDRLLEKNLFEERKTALLMERQDLKETLAQFKDGSHSVPDRLAEFLELAGNVYLNWKLGLPDEKRDLLTIVTSNRLVEGKTLTFELNLPFSEVAGRAESAHGAPGKNRTPMSALEERRSVR